MYHTMKCLYLFFLVEPCLVQHSDWALLFLPVVCMTQRQKKYILLIVFVYFSWYYSCHFGVLVKEIGLFEMFVLILYGNISLHEG